MPRTERKLWIMPEWMKPYERHFNNTGGNTVEELITEFNTNDTLARTNFPLYTLAAMAFSQARLLIELHNQGLLAPLPAPEETP